MTEWGYHLETYKATLHLYEILFQSLVWPLVTLMFILAVRFCFWGLIQDLFKGRRVDSLGVGDMRLTLTESVIETLNTAAETATPQEREKIEQAISILKPVGQLFSYYIVVINSSKTTVPDHYLRNALKDIGLLHMSEMAAVNIKQDSSTNVYSYFVVLGIVPAPLENIKSVLNERSKGFYEVIRVQDVEFTAKD